MKNAILIGALCIALCACSRTDDRVGADLSPLAIDGACKSIGNDPVHHYCATTFIQLLANPDRYDGHFVYLQGWAGLGQGGAIILFPSRDSVLGVETHGSLLLRSGPELGTIAEHLSRFSPDGAPTRVWVGGRFSLNRQMPGNKMTLSGLDIARFGALEDVDKFDF